MLMLPSEHTTQGPNIPSVNLDVLLLELGLRIMGSRCSTENIHLLLSGNSICICSVSNLAYQKKDLLLSVLSAA